MTPEVVWVENHCQASDAVNHGARNKLPNEMMYGEECDEDEDEEDGHDLPTHGEWTLLPDGTKQIFNLYKVSQVTYVNSIYFNK